MNQRDITIVAVHNNFCNFFSCHYKSCFEHKDTGRISCGKYVVYRMLTKCGKSVNIKAGGKSLLQSYYLLVKSINYKRNHTIFRHDNFIGCFSADKIKMSARKYFCFNIRVYKSMAEESSCRSPYHEEYIQTSASGNPEGLCH